MNDTDDDAAPSEHESVPPPAAGHAVPAAAAAGAAAGAAPAGPQHPLWERAAGRGGGAGKPAPAPVASAGRFGPISMAVLEQRARQELDGASSVGARTAHARTATAKRGGGGGGGARRPATDDDEDDDQARPKRRKAKARDLDDDLEYDAMEDDDALSDAESGADVLASAAFGGGAQSKNPCRSLSVVSDSEDGASVSSSAARRAHARAFPISGETCVGCALPGKVGPVDDFVSANCHKMKQEALFKLAALLYIQKVVDPAEAEGVPVPAWPWKDIRAHYTMHKMDAKMQRYENMRTLGAMRKTLELSLLKQEEDADGNWTHSLDKANAEQILKIISLQSKEISLLHETKAGGAAATSAKK